MYSKWDGVKVAHNSSQKMDVFSYLRIFSPKNRGVEKTVHISGHRRAMANVETVLGGRGIKLLGVKQHDIVPSEVGGNRCQG